MAMGFRRIVALAALSALACSSSGGSGGGAGGSSSGTLNGGLGQVCDADSQCAAELYCNVDTQDWILHRQCSTYCDSSDECKAKFGSHTSCIGANLCVSDCLDDSDCPPNTHCGDFGWCEHTGPGSGVPECTGTPTPCSLLDSTQCIVSGCDWNTSCSGTPTESSCQGIHANLCEYTAGCSLSPQ